MFRNIAEYYFSPSAFSIAQTAYGAATYSDYLILSVRSGSGVRVRGTVKTHNPDYASNNGLLGYADDLSCRDWTLEGANIKLSDTYAEQSLYLYIRLDASTLGTKAELMFSPNNYDFDGFLLTAPGDLDLAHIASVPIGEDGEPMLPKGEYKYFYIAIGVLSAPDALGQRTYSPWDPHAAGGTFKTDKQEDEVKSDFFEDRSGYVTLRSKYLGLRLMYGAVLQFGGAAISGIRVLADGLADWASDAHLATTASIAEYLASELLKLESKYLRKDQDDASPYLVTFGDIEVKKGLERANGSLSSGNANVEGNAQIGGHLIVKDDVEVGDDLTVYGYTYINDRSFHYGDVNYFAGDIQMGQDTSTPDVKNFEAGVKGCKIYWAGTGWHIETDFLTVHKKMYAKEIEVGKVTHVGGEQILTAAACVADHVAEQKDGDGNTIGYVVSFRKEDSDGRKVTNDWVAGDLAYCQTFNIQEGVTEDFANSYYWRLVTDAGTYTDTNTKEEWNYITLSNIEGEYDPAGALAIKSGQSVTAPDAGDHIVQFGNVDDPVRQGVTLLSGAGQFGRAIIMWEAITTFVIPPHRLLLSPGQVDLNVNSLTVRVGEQNKTLQQYITDDVDLNFEGRLIINGDDEEPPHDPEDENDEFIQYLLEVAFGELASQHTIADLVGAVYITTRKTYYMLTYNEETGKYTWREDTDGTLSNLYDKYDEVSVTVSNILYDGCITADEKVSLQNILNQIHVYYDKACAAFVEPYSTDAAVQYSYAEFINAVRQDLFIMLEDKLGILVDKAVPQETVYFEDAENIPEGAIIMDFTRKDMLNTIRKAYAAYEDFQTAIANYNVTHLAESAAKKAEEFVSEYVNQEIGKITGDTLDKRIKDEIIPAWYNASLKTTVDGLTAFQTSTTSTLKAQDDRITATTEWIGEDFASVAGLTTYLNEVFVGTDQLGWEEEKDDQGRQLYQPLKAKFNESGQPLYWKPMQTKDGKVTYIESTESKNDKGESYDRVYVADYTKKPVTADSAEYKANPSGYTKRMVVANRSTSGLVTEEGFAAVFAKQMNADGYTDAIAEMATYVGKVYTSELPADAVKKTMSNNTEYYFSPKLQKNIYISSRVEDIASGPYYYIQSVAAISADNVSIQSGTKSMGDYFSLNHGNLWVQNITVEGVINNLINVLTAQSDEIIPEEEPDHYSLDLLRVGDVVKIESLPANAEFLHIPYYIDTLRQYRTLTKYSSYDEPQPIRPDELRQLIGRRITIFCGDGCNGQLLMTGYDLAAVIPSVVVENKAQPQYADAINNIINGAPQVELPHIGEEIGVPLIPGQVVHLELKVLQFKTANGALRYGYAWVRSVAPDCGIDDDDTWHWELEEEEQRMRRM